MDKTGSRSYNYSDIFYSFFSDKDTVCHDKALIHFLMYVISGEVIVTENGKAFSVRKGECVFVRRDHKVTFSKNRLEDEPFTCITLKLDRNYLRKFYQRLNIDNSLKKTRPLQSSVHLLQKSPYVDSLFLSMLPFFESETEPNIEIIEQKMQEGILTLLNLDESFYPTLFDFADPWKIDIMDFLNENYMYECLWMRSHHLPVADWLLSNGILPKSAN